jgi:glycosyltransferase involved in cell wall biosynthesis
MIAYACDPQGGGEHWLGWGWAEQASRMYEVDLITTPKARKEITERAGKLGITPHFVQGSVTVQKFSEKLNANWWRKFAWQKRAMSLATDLHTQKKFQIVHQTTFHTFRVPFLAAALGIPSVWGPIAGGESVPKGFELYLGSARRSEAVRNMLNQFWLNFPSVKRSLEKAALIFASNNITKAFLPAHCHSKCQIVSPNALRPADEAWVQSEARIKSASSTFNLLYVGNCVATRALPIVFEALHESGLENYQLSIIGDGPAIPEWKRRVSELNLETKIKFIGKVPHSELAQWYATSDLLVFPALRDSGGSALLEAMARFVPVMCLDWAGPGEMVDSNSGVKIPVTDPPSTVSAFAQSLAMLARDPQRRAALAAAARSQAESRFRWQAKREILERAYHRLLQRQ